LIRAILDHESTGTMRMTSTWKIARSGKPRHIPIQQNLMSGCHKFKGLGRLLVFGCMIATIYLWHFGVSSFSLSEQLQVPSSSVISTLLAYAMYHTNPPITDHDYGFNDPSHCPLVPVVVAIQSQTTYSNGIPFIRYGPALHSWSILPGTFNWQQGRIHN
jgi:hypothetical protein